MTDASSTALCLGEQNLPVPYAGFSSLGNWVMRQVALRLWAFGLNRFVGDVNDAYREVVSERHAAAAAESLLSTSSIRMWLAHLGELQRRRRPRPGAEREIPWIRQEVSERMALLRRCVSAFNRWAPAQPGALPPSLTRLLSKAGTPSFHQSFDDPQIPASMRLAYYAHRTLDLHVLALGQAVDGKLPSSIIEPVTEALRVNVGRALGLALGLPGVSHLRDEADLDLRDVEVLDIDEEESEWLECVRAARFVG